MDIPTIGRFASAEDPQGATFVLFKGSLDYAPPSPPLGTPGTVGWNELSANDEQTAWPFYSGIFGWKQDSTMDMGPMGTYRIFNNGGPQMGAVMTRDPGKSPGPFWLYYFNVEDIDAAAARIEEKKGQICMGPHQVPGDLWIVLGHRPPGRHVFSRRAQEAVTSTVAAHTSSMCAAALRARRHSLRRISIGSTEAARWTGR